MTSSDIIGALDMAPHPEGGWFVETWRAPAREGERAVASAILYLLQAGEQSRWHRVDAAEVWQWSGGGTLELRIATPGEPVKIVRLGGEVSAAERPQAVVPAGAWQTARPLAAWVLVGCIVAPAFESTGFELAPEGWEPPA